MKILLFLFFFTVTLNSTYSQTNVNYSRTSRYNALKLSVEEFKNIITDIKYYQDESIKDTSYHNAKYYLTCELSNNQGDAISFSTYDQINKFAIPDSYSDINFRFSSNYLPLSEVTIILNNFTRSIKVTGADENKVEALYSKINSRLDSKIHFFSWINWSGIMLFVLIFTCSLGVSVVIYLLQKIKELPAKTKVMLFLVILYLAAAIIYFMSPITVDDIFPKFQLTPDTTNWWDRNANLLGFVSFIITIGTLGYNMIAKLRNNITN